jgi:predicted nuclease of predicted toxin-antitoxin system
VKLLIDENLSPRLVDFCARKDLYAVSVPHVGLSGRADSAIWRYAIENDFVVVTANTRDFIELLDVELHPGLIVLREGDLSRTEQWERLDRALDRILRQPNPDRYMINRVVEIISTRDIRVREIPPAGG